MTKIFPIQRLFFVIKITSIILLFSFALKKDIVVVGESKNDQRLVELWEINDFKLFPDYTKQFGDSIFIEFSPCLIDTDEKNGIIGYRFRYKKQKKLRHVNSTGTYELYYYFLLINGERIPLWNKSKAKKEIILKRNFNKLKKIFNEKEIIDKFDRTL
jgi:hypothetical protein